MSKIRVFWKIYFYIWILITIFIFADTLTGLTEKYSIPFDFYVAFLVISLGTLSSLSLFGYTFRKPFLQAYVWKIVFLILLCLIISLFSVVLLNTLNQLPKDKQYMQWLLRHYKLLAVLGTGSILISLNLFALYQYGWDKGSLWFNMKLSWKKKIAVNMGLALLFAGVFNYCLLITSTAYYMHNIKEPIQKASI